MSSPTWLSRGEFEGIRGLFPGKQTAKANPPAVAMYSSHNNNSSSSSSSRCPVGGSTETKANPSPPAPHRIPNYRPSAAPRTKNLRGIRSPLALLVVVCDFSGV